MKLAYIITVHKDSSQAIRLIERLNTGDTYFVVHICLNADKEFVNTLKTFFKGHKNVIFCKRSRATIFSIGFIDGVMNAIEALIDNKIDFDYVSLLSGQDYPIKSNAQILSFLSENAGKEFLTAHRMDIEDDAFYKDTVWQRKESYRIDSYWLRFKTNGHLYRFPVRRFIDKPLWLTMKIFIYEIPKNLKKGILLREFTEFFLSRVLPSPRKFIKTHVPYGAWAWWTLSRDCVYYALKTYRSNTKIRRFFKYTWNPDELVFQTIIMNSPFKEKVTNNSLREIVFPKIENADNSHPVIFKAGDFDLLSNSPNLYARKFDANSDSEILALIDKHILKPD